jgi:hypothetical protein
VLDCWIRLLHCPCPVSYAVIYALCMWVLIRRRRENYLWHTISSTILFTLASLQVGILIPIFSLIITSQSEYTTSVVDSSNHSFTLSSPTLHSAYQLSSTLDVTILLSLQVSSFISQFDIDLPLLRTVLWPMLFWSGVQFGKWKLLRHATDVSLFCDMESTETHNCYSNAPPCCYHCLLYVLLREFIFCVHSLLHLSLARQL